MSEHISEELFERFLRVEASREESRRVVEHLISGCPECSALAVRLTAELGLWPSKSAKPGWEQAYEEILSRAMAFASEEEQRLAVEKLRGWAQWAELEPVNPQIRVAMVENDPSYHTFGLYDRLIEASRVRQDKLGASCRVRVPAGKGLTSHPYRVLQIRRRRVVRRTERKV